MSRELHGLSIQKSFKTPEALRKIFAFVAAVSFLLSTSLSFAENADPTYDKMTLKQKVGQVFIWTYGGTDFSPHMARWLATYQPGALIVFKRNIKSAEQIARVNQRMQALAAAKMKAPLFLMIDQEGGPVTRLRTEVPLPSARSLGKMNDPEFIQKFARAKADALRALGFNVNLAPVLDISNATSDSFIGNRAFGDDPETVSELADAYAQGISDGGVMPTAKHYPGHGGLVQDSHKTTPKKPATYEELAGKDLLPFEDFAQSQYPRAMMMAHLALPAIDSSGVPTTYSKVLIQDYLRGKLEYDGLVITDDLEMNGAATEDDIGERAVRAFLAGNDMLMFAGTAARQKKAFETMLAAVKDGKISEARLKESVTKILAYKKELKLGAFVFNEKKAKAAIAQLDNLSREILKKNFRLSLSGKTAKWPEVHQETQALVLSGDKQFYSAFQSTFRGKATFYLLTPQSLEGAAKALASDKYTMAVFYASGSQTARWLSRLPAESRAKTIVINANHDGDVEDQSSFMSVLNIGSRDPEAGSNLAEALGSPEFRVPASDTKEND